MGFKATGNQGLRASASLTPSVRKASGQKSSIKSTAPSFAPSKADNNKDQSSDKGEIAKSASNGVQAFAHTRPGNSAEKQAKLATRNIDPTANSIAARYSPYNNRPEPGSALNNINNFRSSINDQGAFQQMVRMSAEGAKTIADGIARAFAGFGSIGEGLVKAAQKNGGASSSGGGAQSSGQGGGGAQQSSAQDQEMFAQDDMQMGGGANA